MLLLAGPLVAANVSRTVMSFVDFAMVSRLGSEAQAAVGPAGLVLWTLGAFGIGIMSLVSTFASQSLGRGRRARCAAYTWQGLYVSAILGLAMVPLAGVAAWMFRISDHPAAVMEMEIIYTRIALYSVGPMTACVALVGFFAGIHHSGIGLVAALIANLFNVAANYALIFGHFGCPAMGIAGAAWATVLSSVLQMVILLGWFLRRRYRQRFATHRALRPRWKLAAELLGRGVPAGLQFSVDIGAWTVFAIYFVGRFGEASLAANTICFRILEVSFMPASGLGQALSAAFGRAFGAGDLATARRMTRWCLLLMVAYMGSIGIAMAVFRVELPALFTDDDEVIRIAASLMILCALFQVFDALQITYNGALRGAGDTLWPAAAVIALLLVVFIGGSWATATLRPQWGAVGVWCVATGYLACVGFMLSSRYCFGPWDRMKIVGD